MCYVLRILNIQHTSEHSFILFLIVHLPSLLSRSINTANNTYSWIWICIRIRMCVWQLRGNDLIKSCNDNQYEYVPGVVQ